MEFDLADKAGLITRTVEVVDREAKPAKLLTAARTYPTSVEDLWDAITNIERIPRWFLPITGELRPGGRFQLEGQAGGKVLECEPPHRFEITWEYGGDISWVTVELTPRGDGAEAHLELRHIAHVPDELWDEFGPGAVGIGWDLALMGLDLHVASGASIDPAEVQAWQGTADARAFITQSSAAWTEASIAGGTDPTAAKESGERATSAYLGTDE
jgi:uncharacterized protein YndB with AHSA1/START domain